MAMKMWMSDMVCGDNANRLDDCKMFADFSATPAVRAASDASEWYDTRGIDATDKYPTGGATDADEIPVGECTGLNAPIANLVNGVGIGREGAGTVGADRCAGLGTSTFKHGVLCLHTTSDAKVSCVPASKMSWADRCGQQDNFDSPYPSQELRGTQGYISGGLYSAMSVAQKTAYDAAMGSDADSKAMLIKHGLGTNQILSNGGWAQRASHANTGFGAELPSGTDPCSVPSLSIACPQTCLAKQGFYTRPDGKQIGTLYCFLTHMQEEFAKALGDQVIDGSTTGVLSTAQGGSLYDFKGLASMTDKELTKWAASNVVEIEFKAAASSMGPYIATDANANVTKAELLYYFASICNPDGVLAAKMMPKFDELFAEFDYDVNGELTFLEFFDFYEYAMDMSIQAYGPVEL